MPIEFHCEHCNKVIHASDAEAGQMGKCPFCKGRTYIPRDEGGEGEIPLAPLDDVEERRRERSAAEDAAIQMKLLRDKARDRDPSGKPAFKRVDVPSSSSSSVTSSGSGASRKQITGAIVSYIEAMSTGNLEKAEKLTSQLSEDRRTTAGVIDEMMSEDLSAYGLPALPRPVLVGFLKQLRGRM